MCWFEPYTFFYYLDCEAIGTAATPGLLCQLRVIVKIVEKQMKCRLAGETEVLGENLPQRHFSPSQNPTWRGSGLNPGHRGGKPATNCLSYGVAISAIYLWLYNLAFCLSEAPLSVTSLCNPMIPDCHVTLPPPPAVCVRNIFCERPQQTVWVWATESE
jgi:hypothetical protein